MEELGYIRLGELIPGTYFTLEELTITKKKKIKVASSQKWKIIGKWINYADKSDKKLMLCAPFLGGQYQTGENMRTFLSVDEMVTVDVN